MSLAFVFPGQASQSIGMMSALAKISPVIEATFAEASAVLDLDGRPRPLLPEQQPAEVRVGADGFTQ